MQKDNLIYIHHIYDCIIKIDSYTASISLDEYLKNSLIHDTVIRNFEIKGELQKNSPLISVLFPLKSRNLLGP